MPSTKRAIRLKPRVSRIAISATGCPGELGDRLCQAARFTLARNSIMRGELEIAVVGGREMRQLHKQWLGDAGATDVLAFDLREEASSQQRSSSLKSQASSLRPQVSSLVDGQIVVCRTVARAEARRRRLDWRDELILYVIHGCLHLVGYDDRTAAAAGRMAREQTRLLRQFVQTATA